MTKIEQYDDDICRLRGILNQYPIETYYSDYYDLKIDYITAKRLKDLIKREVERLTAERNCLIRGD